MTVRDDALMLLAMREIFDHFRGPRTNLPRDARILGSLQQALELLEEATPERARDWISRREESLAVIGNDSFSSRLTLLTSLPDDAEVISFALKKKQRALRRIQENSERIRAQIEKELEEAQITLGARLRSASELEDNSGSPVDPFSHPDDVA